MARFVLFLFLPAAFGADGRLLEAVQKRDQKAVLALIKSGADVNAANSMGITAVIGAANRGSDDMLAFLVQHGAKLDVKDKEGRTPLVWAGGVFLATNPPEEKPSTMALIKKLMNNE